MALLRDMNVRVTPDSYIFASPSSPDAPALVVDRPTGDLRLESSPKPRRISRVSSIAGILGIVHLRLGGLSVVVVIDVVLVVIVTAAACSSRHQLTVQTNTLS
jgi:hypothetical protein